MNKIKRFIRIVFGLLFCPVPMLLSTYIWLWEDSDESWLNTTGTLTWYLASGQWDKLPD